MRKVVNGLFLLCTLLLISSTLEAKHSRPSHSTSIRDRRMFRKAEMHYINAEFDDAILLYEKLVSNHPDNPKINFELGLCYYYSSSARPLSLEYFLAACRFSGKDTSADLIFHTGLAYLSLNKFEEAEFFFKRFKNDKQNQLLGMSIDEMIAKCENGKRMWAVPSRTHVVNLGPNINSIYPDYAAIVTRDHSKLIFTSKREGTTGGKKDPEGFYYEDVYMSRATGAWSNSQRIDTGFVQPKLYDLKLWFGKAQNIEEINTSRHDGSVALSPDEKSLYIFRTDDVWRSELVNDEWKNPVRLNETIDNSKTYEPSVFITHDGNTLYFVSDRTGGIGGKDIWVCSKTANGDWGNATDLGENINSSYNEESPFVTDDGNTMYFSSEGHDGIGGYDVFRSEKDANGNWSAAENLGAPVNNGDDDVFFYPDESNNTAFYSTLNRTGKGSLDIYQVQFYPEAHDVAKLKLAGNSGFRGSVNIVLHDLLKNSDTTFTISTDKQVIYHPDLNGKYLITVSADGFTPFTDTLDLKTGTNGNMVMQEIALNSQNDKSGEKETFDLVNHFYDIDRIVDADATLPLDQIPGRRDSLMLAANTFSSSLEVSSSAIHDEHLVVAHEKHESLASIYFDFDRSDIRPDMIADAQRIYDWMMEHPDSAVVLTGNTDSKGSPVYNKALSARRANAVKDYVASKGIKRSRIRIESNGEEKPAAPNENNDGSDNPNGRSLNRRVDVNILH